MSTKHTLHALKHLNQLFACFLQLIVTFAFLNHKSLNHILQITHFLYLCVLLEPDRFSAPKAFSNSIPFFKPIKLLLNVTNAFAVLFSASHNSSTSSGLYFENLLSQYSVFSKSFAPSDSLTMLTRIPVQGQQNNSFSSVIGAATYSGFSASSASSFSKYNVRARWFAFCFALLFEEPLLTPEAC
ncbi:hypothetical protein HanXRQr2_Chr04g0144411 [Helianthus annuus]|uniref:Uncharacterized protein n=1 Tax=Helianthus annuus TaxID=4232 RepID=A0A9K3NPK0_HELAN|nr:hypothetical protein HanXRQr2_Chr04g0144411 [Helianthus annuus]